MLTRTFLRACGRLFMTPLKISYAIEHSRVGRHCYDHEAKKEKHWASCNRQSEHQAAQNQKDERKQRVGAGRNDRIAQRQLVWR